MAASTTMDKVSVSTGPAAPEHQPYVPDNVRLPEFTLVPVLVGALLGIIFGASSLYLVLKVGMTVSASIPVAVLSITLFRVFSKLPFVRRANILENNIVQTTGSAGESIAFGVGVTMPALMLIGFEMDVGRVMVVSILGGLLGILMMIPLRRAFIVQKHGVLRYPEGTACAEVLIAGEEGGATAKTVFVGFGIAFLFQFVRLGMQLFKDTVSTPLRWFKGASPALETDPTLLGVGYIIGTRFSCIMVAGGVLASFVLIPAITLFGEGLTRPLYPETTRLIRDMSEEQIHRQYILYIGAGAVAAGGIISLIQALPLIFGSIAAAYRDLRASGRAGQEAVPRTSRDMPLWVVGVGAIGLVVAIWLTTPLHQVFDWVPDLHMNPLGACLIVLFGFLFVTVSSRLTGEIGSSNNPISGMTVATLLLTCLIFFSIDWTSRADQLTALSIAAVVCIASSNGGTTSQDLKTGYLVGATPKWQQWAILIGALSSALVIGVILIKLNKAYTVYTTKDLPALKKPIDVRRLTETGRAQGHNDDTLYHVLRVGMGKQKREDDYGLPAGEYLVNDQGEIVYLVDPGINGTRKHRDDGTEVQKFSAPKATLMGFITSGILDGNLPWGLVLIGVSIAVVLELCGISSLAFAVGVYLPLATSTPIFVGGLVRYVADHWGRPALSGQPPSEADSDSSSGVLLATGYIAGGAIAGVLVAFLNFSDTIPRLLTTWKYREVAISREQSLDEAARQLAIQELGRPPKTDAEKDDAKDLEKAIGGLNEDVPAQFLRVPRGTVLHLPGGKSFTVAESAYLGKIAEEPNVETAFGGRAQAQSLLDLNLDRLIVVPQGTTELKLPDGKAFKVTPGTPLGEVARAALGTPDKAAKLYKANEDKLQPPVKLPAGTELRVPQRNAPALAVFGVLVVFLVLVGGGWLLRSPPPDKGSSPPPPSGDGPKEPEPPGDPNRW